MNTVVDFILNRDLTEEQVLNKVNEGLNDLHVPNALFLKEGQIRFLKQNMLEQRTKEFAINFIESMQINMAMPIAGDLPPTDTKEILECRQRVEAAKARFAKIDADTSVKNFSYEFLQCPKCRSRLNREYLPNGSICPLCQTDLRKEAALAKLAKAQEKIDKTEEALKQAIENSRKANMGKGPEKWFVRIYVDCVLGESSSISMDYTEPEHIAENPHVESNTEQAPGNKNVDITVAPFVSLEVDSLANKKEGVSNE